MSNDLFSKQDTALRSVGNTHMSQRLDLRQLISDAFRDAYIRFADNDDKQRSEIAEEPDEFNDPEWKAKLRGIVERFIDAETLTRSASEENTSSGFDAAWLAAIDAPLDRLQKLATCLANVFANKNELRYDELMKGDVPSFVRVISRGLMQFAGVDPTPLEATIASLEEHFKSSVAYGRAIFNRAIDIITEDAELSEKALSNTLDDEDISDVCNQAMRALYPKNNKMELDEVLNKEVDATVFLFRELANVLESHGDGIGEYAAEIIRVDIKWRERNLRQSIAEKLEEVYSDDFHE